MRKFEEKHGFGGVEGGLGTNEKRPEVDIFHRLTSRAVTSSKKRIIQLRSHWNRVVKKV